MADEKTVAEKLANEWYLFKQDNDKRVAELEKKGRTDPLTEEKINKHSEAIGEIQKQLETLSVKLNRPGVSEKAGDEADKVEHRKAFGDFLRKGNTAALEEMQSKAVNLGSDPEGGFLVPDSLDSEIETHERDNTPMRQLCKVMTLSNENWEKLVNKGGATSGWVDENESRTETTAPTLAALKPYFGEVYAMPAATQKSLDDAAWSVESWLAEEVGLEFGEQENDAFTNGTGVKKPKGILGYTLSTSADGSRTFGEIQKVHSGSSGVFIADKLIDLVYALKRGYRANAQWMTTASGVAAMRKLKDGQNNYLFQPSFIAGEPATLLGYAIQENDDLPVPAADANAALFGDFKRAYTIIDIQGVRVLRDPFTSKGKVLFYTTKRIGGFLVQDRAIKVYTLSA